jgi:hypothetical protein
MGQDQVTRRSATTMARSEAKRAAPGDELRMLIVAGQAWTDGCQAMNAEMLAFWQSRLKAGLALGGELLECTSIEGALEVQLDHAKAAVQAYLDQSGRITRLLLQALDGGSRREPVPGSPAGQTRALAA